MVRELIDSVRVRKASGGELRVELYDRPAEDRDAKKLALVSVDWYAHRAFGTRGGGLTFDVIRFPKVAARRW